MSKMIHYITTIATTLKKLFHQWLYSPVKLHLAFLNQQMDPICEMRTTSKMITDNTSKSSTKQIYLIISIVIFSGVYGTIGLQYEATNGSLANITSLTTLRSSPFIFTHQISHHSVWFLFDFCIYSDIVASICLFVAVIVHRDTVHEKGQIFLRNDKILFGSKELTDEESKMILLKRRRIKRFCQFLILLLVLCMDTFLYANVWLNSVYTLTFGSIVFWLILIPWLIFYLCYALYGLLVYVILASRYLRIRQQTLLTRFAQINSNLAKIKRSHRSVVLSLAWRQYAQVNKDSVHLCSVIREQVHFCSPLLSIILPFYVSILCYLMYISFYIDFPVLQKQIFYLSIVELNAFLCLIIHECSRIAKLGRQLEVCNRQFCFLFSRQGGAEFRNKAKLVKAETFQTARRFHPFAFKLFGNYRITSKTYHVIFSYVSSYFMFVCDKL